MLNRFILALVLTLAVVVSAQAQIRVVGGTGGGAGGVAGPVDTITSTQAPLDGSALTPVLAGAGAGNVDNGVHRYKFTQADSDGHETLVGAATPAVTVTDKTTNGKVTVALPYVCDSLLPNVSIYRTVAGGSVYKLVERQEWECGTTYTDNTADASLGEDAPSTSTAQLSHVFAGDNWTPPASSDWGGANTFINADNFAFEMKERASGDGGPISIYGGYTLNGDGGRAGLFGGGSANGTGGQTVVAAGRGFNGGGYYSPGTVYLGGGDPGNNIAGYVSIVAGGTNVSGGNGGHVVLEAGRNVSGTGGDITLRAGHGTAGDGNIEFIANTQDTNRARFDLTQLGNRRTFTFPDLSGTFALTSGTQTLTNKTLTAPTIAKLANLTTNGVVTTTGGDGTLVVVPTAGKVVQVVNTQTGAMTTGTTQIPVDDTIPQNTEGDEYLSLTITPTSATNMLRVDVVFMGATPNTANTYLTVALFQDATANALAVSSRMNETAFSLMDQKFSYYVVAGTTSATTFKVRAGANASGTTTFNGRNGGRLFGGVLVSSITITEIVP